MSGIVDVYNDAKEVVNQRLVSADADIFVRVDIPYEEHLPYLCLLYTSNCLIR